MTPVLLLLIALSITLTGAISPPFSPNHFPPHLGAVHAIRHLDGTLILAGLLRPPARAPFTDAHPLSALPSHVPSPSATAFLARLHPNATILWGRRVAPIPPSARVSLAIDAARNLYVAAVSTGLALSDHTISAPVPFVARFDEDGKFSDVKQLMHIGHDVVALEWLPARENALVLVTEASPEAPIMRGVENPAEKAGVVVARLATETLQLELARPLSVGKGLVRDTFWDVAPARTDVIYIAVKRQTVSNWIHSFVPTVIKVGVHTLQVEDAPRSLPKDLQNRVAMFSDPRGVFIAYVSRVYNKEALVVRRLAQNLTDLPWGGAESSVFRRPIEMDLQYTRSIRSDVADLVVGDDGLVQVLLHAAEIIDRTEPDYEENRKLPNGRPALVILTSAQAVANISQSDREDQWHPNAMVAGDDQFYVVGGDRGAIGSQREGEARLLLTTVERLQLPSRSPTPSPAGKKDPLIDPIKDPEDGDSKDSEEGNNETCVGASTMIGGQSMRRIVRGDPRLRLQRHPLLAGRQWIGLEPASVPMLCTSWRNATDEHTGRLCATERHVVRWHGKSVFMHELCSEISDCRRVEDEPLSFKGPCGVDVVAHEFLAITMHASKNIGIDARQAVREECLRMQKAPLAWLLSTL